MTDMTTTIKSQANKILEEAKKDPGRPAKEIAKATGLREDIIRKILKELEASEEHETRRIMAKNAAYSKGGKYIVKQIKKEPNSGYRLIDASVREGIEKDRIKREDTEAVFKRLVEYCRTWKDAELRELLLKHKNAGGWMPR